PGGRAVLPSSLIVVVFWFVAIVWKKGSGTNFEHCFIQRFYAARDHTVSIDTSQSRRIAFPTVQGKRPCRLTVVVSCKVPRCWGGHCCRAPRSRAVPHTPLSGSTRRWSTK